MRALIALDGSEHAKAVAEAVGRWLTGPGAEAELCTILDESEIRATAASTGTVEITPQGTWSGSALRVDEPAPRIVEDRSQALARAQAEAIDRLQRLGESHLGEMKWSVHVLASDDTVRAILDEAEAYGADVIAMGTHGRSVAGRALFGSIAEAVVRDTPVPVFLVRRKR